MLVSILQGRISLVNSILVEVELILRPANDSLWNKSIRLAAGDFPLSILYAFIPILMVLIVREASWCLFSAA